MKLAGGATADMENYELFYKFRWQLALIVFGLILSAAGVFLMSPNLGSTNNVEIIEEDQTANDDFGEIVVEVSGEVHDPGVKRLGVNARVDDALVAAGGLTGDADGEWVDKKINRAAKLTDGQKLYIPQIGEQSEVLSANKIDGYQSISSEITGLTEEKVNINEVSQKELEELWGIGPVYAQNIIEHRPYSTPEELLTKGILKENVYERNKDLFSVY